jgi:hypothetical protein
MSLVTRVSVAFLVALALALGGFSACLYYLAGLRLRLALDQELEATLDRFPERTMVDSGRVTWAIYDEMGRRVDGELGTGRAMILDGRDLGPLAVDVATTIEGPDGLSAADAGGAGRPRRAAVTITRGHQDATTATAAALAANGSLEYWPHGPRSNRWSLKSDRWPPCCLFYRWCSGLLPRESATISAAVPSLR